MAIRISAQKICISAFLTWRAANLLGNLEEEADSLLLVLETWAIHVQVWHVHRQVKTTLWRREVDTEPLEAAFSDQLCIDGC